MIGKIKIYDLTENVATELEDTLNDCCSKPEIAEESCGCTSCVNCKIYDMCAECIMSITGGGYYMH